jgi:hypothetical protein
MNHDSLGLSKTPLLETGGEIDIAFRDCSVEANVPRQPPKMILNSTSGIAKSGEILAIMGPSGEDLQNSISLLS